MKSSTIFLALLLVVFGGALAFRLPRLGDRPMHADEAVQAARFRDLWLRGRYVYDPHEFHGPTLPYATLPSVWIGGPERFAETTEVTYRIVPVLFGAGLVLLLGLLGDAVGKPAAVSAGVLAAVSPAFVYFSRYYVHETLLVFFTLAAIAAGWRYLRDGRLAWCLAGGACVGLMQATKETCVLAYLAAAGGLGFALLWARLRGEAATHDPPGRPRWHLALGLSAAVVVAAVLLSSFFTNARGPVDAVLTYLPWAGRAGRGSLHEHPWYEYLQRLAYWRTGDGPLFSEGLILALAAVGFVASLAGEGARGKNGSVRRDSGPFVRWVGFYTIVLTVLYSAIPYKTPWCLLGFFQGMILLAGVGAVVLLSRTPTLPLKGLVTLILLGGACHLGWQSYRASYVLSADPRNPYVYAHTLPDAVRLSSDVAQLVRATPDGEAPAVRVIWQDGYYWPLPWYLRKFEPVAYCIGMPDDPAAPVVIATPQFDAALTEELDATHLMTGYYGLRPNVLAELWVRMDVWEAHLRRLGRL